MKTPKFLLAFCICLILCTLFAQAQTSLIIRDVERIVGEDDIIDGETLGSLDAAGVDSDGNIAVEARNPSGVSGDAVVVVTDGEASIITIIGDPVPGGGIVERIDDHVERVGNRVLYTAERVDDDPTNVAGVDVLLLRDLAMPDAEVVVRVDTTLVPGRAVPFDFLPQAEGYGLSSNQVAFVGSYDDGGVGQGVYLHENGVLSTLIDTDDTIDGVAIENFRNAMPDENGPDILFQADLVGGDQGLFVYRGGQVIERLGTGDSVPNSAATFTEFGEADIDAGNIVVQAVDSNGDEGIYLINSQGEITVVADQTTPLPEGFVDTGPAVDGFLDAPGIAGPFVFFVARRETFSEVMIWQNGLIERMPNRGDIVDGQEVSTTSGNLNRHNLADGFMTLDLSFIDDTEATYRVRFGAPEPTAVPLPAVASILALLLVLTAGLALTRTRTKSRI